MYDEYKILSYFEGLAIQDFITTKWFLDNSSGYTYIYTHVHIWLAKWWMDLFYRCFIKFLVCYGAVKVVFYWLIDMEDKEWVYFPNSM